MLSLAGASEAPSEISTEQSQQSDSFFGRLVGLVTSFFSWSIATFGNGLGKVLGWLGVGTPLLFLLWVIKKIVSFFVNKHIISPAKRAINKHSVQRGGRNFFKNEKLEYKHALSEWDIRWIVEEKYGCVHNDNETRDGHEVYASWTYAGLTWFGVFFCDDGVRTYKGLFSEEKNYMSYNELRNGDVSMETLKWHFDGYPDEFYNMLMEIREA